MLDLPGFDYSSSEEIKAEALNLAQGESLEFVSGLDNGVSGISFHLPLANPATTQAVPLTERVADVPIHFADMLVRYAPALQKTKDAAIPVARMNSVTLARLGIASSGRVKVMRSGIHSDGAGDTVDTTKNSASHDIAAMMHAELDANLPDNVIRIATGHATTVAVGPMFTTLRVEKA